MESPVFQPIEGVPASSIEIPRAENEDEEIRTMIAAIESDDIVTAEHCIQKFLNGDIERSSCLQYCLCKAVGNLRETIVRAILSRKTTIINQDVLEAAIKARSTSMLFLFLEYGWDLNEELGPWQPPPLA